ncbi:hypothetical protein ILUMI_14881 [Ignelater luminosus]|uniref:Uncharacterized protein n=1 Tax=Ignelater luminosus TaxID=2038154 RepID=A0A8K0CTD9_IGNLU|nr:hypothetical protein ILUMI_14881 [Ignelater luminosus]
MTIYEQFNQKRKQELLPFFEAVYLKNLTKAQANLAKINSSNLENLENEEVFAEKLTVNNHYNSKLTGTTRKGRTTTAHVSKIKPLKQSFPLQDRPPPDPPDLPPGPSAGPDTE